MLSPSTQKHYRTVADWCASKAQALPCPIIGINGAQGSGKSTLAKFLVEVIGEKGLRCAVLSIDDCYLSRAERAQLAQDVHPLLLTRGVPGTHDVALGMRLLDQLRNLEAGETLLLPRFSKAEDDRLPESDWVEVAGPFDLILFEGWCVGLPPQREAELDAAVNALEREADTEGVWRRYVNDQLAGAYAEWFGNLDALVFLQVPEFGQVMQWRQQQESETTARAGEQGQGLMTTSELERFIQHYERLTRHAFKRLPSQADVCISIDTGHSVTAITY